MKHGENPTERTGILLVDDHPLVRQALRDTISREADLTVCGEAENRDTALAAIASLKPALVIVDLGLKQSDGLQLIKDIRDRFPKVLTLVLSMHDELVYAERAVRVGASGYISKRDATTRIMEAVRKVLAGEIYWSEKVAAQVASKVARPGRFTRNWPGDCLSERELEIFELVGVGTSTSQIALALHIDVSTVETYRSRIKEKMKLKNADELLQRAIQWNVTKVLGAQ